MCKVIFGYEQTDHLILDDFQRADPSSTDVFDGNWVYCTYEIRSGKFFGEHRECFRLDEFETLLSDLRLLEKDHSKRVSYQTMEEWITFDLSIDRLGHIYIKGNIIDANMESNELFFQMTLDYMVLLNAIKGLQTLLEKFPVVR
jgi:hypothetical protein